MVRRATLGCIPLVFLVSGALVRASSADESIFAAPAELSLTPKFLADEPTSAPAEGEAEANEKSAEALAKLTQNPVANLISVPFQNNFNFGIGPKHAMQWVLNIQPVIPFKLNDEWNLITRTIMPIIYQESPADGVPYASGLGDINPTFFFSPVQKFHGIIWGFGPTFTLPTGTDPQLTSGEWTAGPAAVALRIDGPWVYGALINQQWSFAGWGDNVSAMLIQPFVNYNFKGGWYLTSGPIITANWKADSDNVWTVPIGGGGGKIIKFGKLPVNISLQGFYNVVTPDDFGADWQLRFQVQFLFPR